MTIKTKFEISQKVFFKNEDGYYQIGKIVGIIKWDDYNKFTYDIVDRQNKNHFRNENEIYLTKEEVLDSVFTKSQYDLETDW